MAKPSSCTFGDSEQPKPGRRWPKTSAISRRTSFALPSVPVLRSRFPSSKAVRVLQFGALTLLALEAFGFAGGAAGAAPRRTLYVNRSSAACSDGPRSGSQARPFCTISAAADRASAGVTVKVAKGTYRERVKVRASGTARRPIVFTAAHGAKVV